MKNLSKVKIVFIELVKRISVHTLFYKVKELLTRRYITVCSEKVMR